MTYTAYQSDELNDFDEDLSEVELMVLLSGMVGGDFSRVGVGAVQ